MYSSAMCKLGKSRSLLPLQSGEDSKVFVLAFSKPMILPRQLSHSTTAVSIDDNKSSSHRSSPFVVQ
jgi:hypothetical protein